MRPPSIAELAQCALSDSWDPSRRLRYWLQLVQGWRNKAKTLAEEDRYEEAFVLFARAATIMLERLPEHPDYHNLPTADQRHNLLLNGEDILESLNALKPILFSRFKEWVAQNGQDAMHEVPPLLPQISTEGGNDLAQEVESMAIVRDAQSSSHVLPSMQEEARQLGANVPIPVETYSISSLPPTPTPEPIPHRLQAPKPPSPSTVTNTSIATPTQPKHKFSISLFSEQCELYEAACDEAIQNSIVGMAQNALGNAKDEAAIIELSPTHLTTVVKIIQLSLDSGLFSCSGDAKRALRLMIKIAKVGGPLPSSLFTTGNVIERDHDAECFGGFSDVYRATAASGQYVALKRIRISPPKSQKVAFLYRIYQEALVWKQLRHPFILPFLGIDQNAFPGLPCLVSPWMENGTILDHLLEKKPDAVERQKLAAQIAEGVQYLHEFGLVHGDIRGNNVFIDHECRPQLADFGLAGLANTLNTLYSATGSEAKSDRWAAPELHDHTEFGFDKFKRTHESDVYAFACLFLEIFTEKPPFHKLSTSTQVFKAVTSGRKPAVWPVDSIEPIPQGPWQVIEECWSTKSIERPKIEKVLEILRVGL